MVHYEQDGWTVETWPGIASDVAAFGPRGVEMDVAGEAVTIRHQSPEFFTESVTLPIAWLEAALAAHRELRARGQAALAEYRGGAVKIEL